MRSIETNHLNVLVFITTHKKMLQTNMHPHSRFDPLGNWHIVYHVYALEPFSTGVSHYAGHAYSTVTRTQSSPTLICGLAVESMHHTPGST